MVFQTSDAHTKHNMAHDAQDAAAAHYSWALDCTDNDKYQIFNDNL